MHAFIHAHAHIYAHTITHLLIHSHVYIPPLTSMIPYYIVFTGKISRLSYESPRTVLLKMLDGTAATLRTNFFNDDRYALSLRVRALLPSPPSVQYCTVLYCTVLYSLLCYILLYSIMFCSNQLCPLSKASLFIFDIRTF